MLEQLAKLFSLIVQPAYNLTGSWWAAIFLFTLATKIILMPLALWTQQNSIVMVKIMPEMFRLKTRYFGDRETIEERQNELNKKAGYHPLLSLIPLAIQVVILFGLVDVIHGITDSGAPGTEFRHDPHHRWRNYMDYASCRRAFVRGARSCVQQDKPASV